MKNCSAYLKMRILGAIDFASGNSIQERIKNVAQMTFLDEEGFHRKFTWRTIETWRLRYKKSGITGVENKYRKDKGQTRKMTPEELLEAIQQALPSFRNKTRYNKSDIYRLCVEKGIIRKELCAPTTFYRLIRKFELLKEENEMTNKKRLAFSKQYANQLWQADTLFGPFVQNGKQKVQTKLIAFIDDASRVVCHGEFFLHEKVDTLIKAFKAALYKRGVPEQLYVDHGSIYASKELSLICSRLGTLLSFAPVRDGAAKGKIERFFRTCRDQFLARKLDLSNLDELNKQFIFWLEEQYNSKTHSAIGMKPIDRFGLDLSRIRYLPPSEANDELFFFEEGRTVKKDNTFPVNNIRYEAPRDLRGKKIQIRFDRMNPNSPIIVFYKEQRMGQAKPLNPTDNDRFYKKGDSK